MGRLNAIIEMAVGLLLAGVLLPVAINSIFTTALNASVSPVVSTVMTILLPVLAVIGVSLEFIPRIREGD